MTICVNASHLFGDGEKDGDIRFGQINFSFFGRFFIAIPGHSGRRTWIDLKKKNRIDCRHFNSGKCEQFETWGHCLLLCGVAVDFVVVNIVLVHFLICSASSPNKKSAVRRVCIFKISLAQESCAVQCTCFDNELATETRNLKEFNSKWKTIMNHFMKLMTASGNFNAQFMWTGCVWLNENWKVNANWSFSLKHCARVSTRLGLWQGIYHSIHWDFYIFGR